MSARKPHNDVAGYVCERRHPYTTSHVLIVEGLIWEGPRHARQIVGMHQDRIFYRCLYHNAAALLRAAPRFARCCKVETFRAWISRERANLIRSPAPALR